MNPVLLGLGGLALFGLFASSASARSSSPAAKPKPKPKPNGGKPLEITDVELGETPAPKPPSGSAWQSIAIGDRLSLPPGTYAALLAALGTAAAVRAELAGKMSWSSLLVDSTPGVVPSAVPITRGAKAGRFWAYGVLAKAVADKRPAQLRELYKLKAASSPAPTPTAPTAPTPTPIGPTKRVIAQRLYDYVTRLIKEGRAAELGSKGAINATVRDAQKLMGGIAADGIYGTATRARGKELLGREFPARDNPKARVSPVATHATPPPVSRLAQSAPITATQAASKPSAPGQPKPAVAPKPVAAPSRGDKQAAQDLLAYARRVLASNQGSQLGTAREPSAIVRSAQADMGELVADGVYGPTTRARGKALTGTTFPART